ncbi:MAG: sodium:solute symporter, partial [Bacteroidota bacterium]|nr:sodium:solute symporter [Bacteroidota bacterium]
GLYALGVLTKVQVRDRWVPWVAVCTPIIGYLISQWALTNYDFDFGFFILALNGAFCFFGLLLIRSSQATPT